MTEKIEVKTINWFDEKFYRIRYLNEAKLEVTDYIPSVTTKLGALNKPFLIQWYGTLGSREANLRKEEQSERGSRIHWAWYTYTTKGVIIYHPPKTPIYSQEELEKIKKRYNNNYWILSNQDEMYQAMKLEKLFKALQPTNIESEKIVFDLKNRDAGTADNIFDIKEGEYLINGSKPLKLEEGTYLFDLKTGNTVGEEAKMQISAYVKCVEAMEGRDIVGALICHTQAKTRSGIDGLATIHLNKDQIEQHYQDFRDVARVWERQFGTLKPIVREIPGIIAVWI